MSRSLSIANILEYCGTVEFGRQDVDFGVLVIQRRTGSLHIAVLSGFEQISAILEQFWSDFEHFCSGFGVRLQR